MDFAFAAMFLVLGAVFGSLITAAWMSDNDTALAETPEPVEHGPFAP